MYLKRRFFPLYGVLNMKVDVKKLIFEMNLIENALRGKWSDLKSSGIYGRLCFQHEDLHARFKNEKGSYSGYEQLSLTEYNEQYGSSELENVFKVEKDKIKKYRSDNARSKNDSKKWVPENDERCYNKIRPLVPKLAPYTLSILQSFSGRTTRVRYAKLAPYFSIKPHIDYDTSYSVRYHIALKTNNESYLAVRKNKQSNFEKKHIPADGKVYFMNTGYEHFAANDSATERIHLVIGVDGQQDIEHLVSKA